MNWSHLEYFLAVARAGSLSKAAKQLQVNHSTVARRLDRLEQQLQVRLFDRLASGYRLTEDGLALEQQAKQVEAQVKRIPGIFSANEAALSGPLKISKPSTGILNLAPLLAEFKQLYPAIELELSATGALTNLSELDVDVAIRLTNNPPEDVIGRKLGKLPIGIYGDKKYLSNVPSHDPSHLSWVVWQEKNSPLNMLANLKASIPNVKVALLTNSYNEVFAAINAGMGVGLLSPLRLPPKHNLQRVEFDNQNYDVELWLLSHPDLRNRERVKAFKTFITEKFDNILGG